MNEGAIAITPQALNHAGLERLNGGDAATAAKLFEQAAALDPLGLPLWLNLAKARRLTGDNEGEAAALAAALAIDARDITALIRSAELFERLGQPAKAYASWSGVIAVAPPAADCQPPLSAVVAHASAFVAARNEAFAREIDAALESSLAAIPVASRRRFDAAMDAATGKRKIYVNECAGLQIPFLPADEFFSRDQFAWLALFEANTPSIRREVEALLAGTGDGIEPYVTMEAGAPPNKWSPLDRSLDWSCYYLWQYGRPINAALAACPATAAALALAPKVELPARAPTAFFSILKPHTRIPPHTGVSNSRATVHLPLLVPPGCGFRVGGETREWAEGQAFAFDDTIEHEAWNNSDQPRVVLIFDVWNPYLTAVERTLLQKFYLAADASKHNPSTEAGSRDFIAEV